MTRKTLRLLHLPFSFFSQPFFLPSVFSHWRSGLRRDWKEKALIEIAKRADDSTWVSSEIQKLQKDSDASVLSENWMTDHMILMTNGEWLVYQSHCNKAKPHLVDDIFLAKGSNAKWYYSTFHFCVQMVGLRITQDTAPGSLPWFAKEYQLREFDGSSDVCLGETSKLPASWTAPRTEETTSK